MAPGNRVRVSNIVTLITCVVIYLDCGTSATNFMIGAGIADITGPAAGINMMGYAKPSQKTAGIHMRQFSRAFVIGDASRKSRIVFVSMDAGMLSQNVRKGVLDQLKKKFPGIYNETNVMLTATHTHSGPGGFHQYVIYQVTSLGFVRETYDSIVKGVVRSVEIAHHNMKPGDILLHQGALDDTNINRSPASYLNNPADERARYKHNTDHDMVLLKMVDADGKGIGMINWFAVHAVSMNNTNRLISSDNKGVAQMMFERKMNPGSTMGQGAYVAAFANSNLGDVSPNMDGPKCSDTGLACDVLSSTCPNKGASCYSQGPGRTMYDSTWMIGKNQYKKAKELFLEEPQRPLSGPVDFRYQYVNMANQTIVLNRTYTVKTCPPSMGYSFAAGTTDGPGPMQFKQGDTTGNPFWNSVRDLIHTPSEELIRCHAPKPILVATGEINFPYPWQPSIVDIQMFRIGQFVLLGVPGEFTTMSGRRLRESVKKVLVENGFPDDTHVVLAGLANSYSSYIATYEEYQVQRYEAASTIYGPHTLTAYIQRFQHLARALATGSPVGIGTPPPDLMDKQLSFVLPVVMDTSPEGTNFGNMIDDAKDTYTQGERVEVSFVTGHPRNDPQLEGTFLTVEHLGQNKTWKVIARDSDWETTYHWVRTNTILGHSKAVITWYMPTNQRPGVYRIRHFGHRKQPITERIQAFNGTSKQFKVVQKTLKSLGRWQYKFNSVLSKGSRRTVV